MLNRRVLAYIVSELQRISLLRTQTDVKGSAYEEFVGANLRGDRGKYFTPRNVCYMAVQMVMSLYSPKRISRIKVLDLCCGTGGFLISYVNHLRQIISIQEQGKGGTPELVRHRAAERIKDLCSQNLYGLDINLFLVRTCQMNLVMYGDGSANVFPANSIKSPGEWDEVNASQRVGHGKFDVVVTNPPFGGKAIIDDSHVLSNYELPFSDSPSMRSSMPAEQLFVEALLKFIKPKGHLAIVFPDSILNNPGLSFIRSWLFHRVQVIASVDFPKETFATSGGVPNPSVLVVKKLPVDEVKVAEVGGLNYDVFMAIPKTAGIAKRGNPVYEKTPEGFEILNDKLEPSVNDEISLVSKSFSEWAQGVDYVNY